MPTEKPIWTFAVDDELRNRIDDFRFDNRINTRSEALRLLIEMGLNVYEGKEGKKPKE